MKTHISQSPLVRLRLKTWALALLLPLALAACEEVVDLELSEGEPRLVVEGLVRDTLEHATVKLSWTMPWHNSGNTPPALGAQVILSDGQQQWTLVDEAGDGTYRSTTQLQLVNERNYLLTIDIDNERYEAESYMRPVAPILGLTHRYVGEADARIGRGEGYYLTLVAQDPPELGDHYYWRVFLDDSLFDGINDVLFTDDEFINGNFIIWEIPITIPRPGQMRVEHMGITKETYDFLSAFSVLVQANGNPFAPQPANPPTNIRCVTDRENYAFGYFGAASVSVGRYEIPEAD